MALKGSRSLDQYNGDEQLEVPVDHNIPTLTGELALAVTKPVSALVNLFSKFKTEQVFTPDKLVDDSPTLKLRAKRTARPMRYRENEMQYHTLEQRKVCATISSVSLRIITIMG